MVAFTIVFTALMAFTYGATKDQIDASAAEEKMKHLRGAARQLRQPAARRLRRARPHPRARLADGGRIPRPQGRPAPPR
jgi:hypothetical protein